MASSFLHLLKGTFILSLPWRSNCSLISCHSSKSILSSLNLLNRLNNVSKSITSAN